ncbi:MAG TPA: oligosaccharide flippase family protein [Geminicoccaceae bacterium]|nr:oligosaccharide flippase family protein [Geminicoccaceae bacterium]
MAGTTQTSLRRRLASGSAWGAAGKIVTAAAALATNALLARLLGAEDLGAYFLLLTVVTVAVSVTHLSVGQTAVRLVAGALAADRPGRARAAMLWALALGGALGGAFALALAFGGGRWLAETLFEAPAMAAAAGLGALWLLVLVLQVLVAEAWRGCGDIRRATLFGGAITGVLAVAALVACRLLGPPRLGLADVLPLLIAAALAGVLLGGWRLARRVAALRGPGTIGPREVAVAAAPLLLTALPWLVLNHADLVILGTFHTPEEVARYGTAARLVALVTMPLLIVNAVLPPVISELYTKGELARLERALRATATYIGLPAAAALALFALFGDTVLGVVYGEPYRAGATVLAILSLGHLITVWSGSCGLTLIQTGENLSVLLVTLVGAAVTVALCLALVGPYGAEGTAAARATGLVVLNLGLWLAVRWRTGMWTHVQLGRMLHPRSYRLELLR